MVSRIEKAFDVSVFVRNAENMIVKYGWQERTVMPYSSPIKVTKIIADLKDFDRCTSGSKEYLIALANGLAPIINAWEEYEQAEKITVRIKKSGKITRINADDLDMFDGLVDVI